MDSHPFIQSSWAKPDPSFELSLRPQTLSHFVGQEGVKKRLSIAIQAALARKEQLSHCLLCGPPGLGKTSLAHILAKAMGTKLVITSGPAIEKAADLAGLLTHLKKGDLLFIDEIHRLLPVAEEYLYPALEDFSLDLMIDSGPNARSVQVKLHPFTLIGATTRSGLLSAHLRSRFPLHLRLDYYEAEELSLILSRSADLLEMRVEIEAALFIAKRSRGIPRIANNLIRWVRDFATAHRQDLVDLNLAQAALNLLEIDEKGLEAMDKKILSVIIDHHEGGPVGLNNIAAALGEEPHTLEEVYEPYLISQGFLKRGPRGREATTLAYQHLGRRRPNHATH